jgi:mannose-6-phosphate isomerase-like protein (cupin superfamily)
MEIHLVDRVVTLEKGEMFVVEKGIEHRPFAKDECKIMIVEPKDIVNTGNKKSLLTSGNDVWI